MAVPINEGPVCRCGARSSSLPRTCATAADEDALARDRASPFYQSTSSAGNLVSIPAPGAIVRGDSSEFGHQC